MQSSREMESKPGERKMIDFKTRPVSSFESEDFDSSTEDGWSQIDESELAECVYCSGAKKTLR